jgi:hypothetical protein
MGLLCVYRLYFNSDKTLNSGKKTDKYLCNIGMCFGGWKNGGELRQKYQMWDPKLSYFAGDCVLVQTLLDNSKHVWPLLDITVFWGVTSCGLGHLSEQALTLLPNKYI